MFKTYTVMELEQSNIQDCSCENSSQLQPSTILIKNSALEV